MTQKPCTSNCFYYVEGRCRLEYRPIEKKPICPYFDGHGTSRGMI